MLPPIVDDYVARYGAQLDAGAERERERAAMTRLGLFIPAYNAAATLARVIARIPVELGPHLRRICIVDDGSEDEHRPGGRRPGAMTSPWCR